MYGYYYLIALIVGECYVVIFILLEMREKWRKKRMRRLKRKRRQNRK